jgi:hypothetical protein
MRRALLILAALLLVPTPGLAQDGSPFTFSGEIRQRSELDARDFNPDTTPADYHLLRTRLNALVQPVEGVDVFVQVQDSRLFGGDPARARGTIDPTAGQLDLHQAYFEISDLFDANLSLKVGRQELAYGNQRLVGSVGWSNIGRTFDAGVLAYEGEQASIDLFAAKLVGTTLEDDGAQNFYGAFSSWQIARGQTLDVFALLDNNTNEVANGDGESVSRLVRFTPGLALRGGLDRLDYTLEAAYQTGKQSVTEGAERAAIGASLLSAKASYVLNPTRNLTLGGGYTRLSGDTDPADDELGAFNTLFATNHKFYGYMDYFPSTLPTLGLQDIQITGGVNISERARLRAAFHHFTLAEATGTGAQTLGQELDVTATYRFADTVTFTAGVSAFLPDEAMEAVRGDDPSYWGYLMTTVTF